MAIAGGPGFRSYLKLIDPVRRFVPRQIIYVDDFEATTLKWGQGEGTVTRDTTTAYQGDASLKMRSAAVLGNAGAAVRSLAPVGHKKLMVEMFWNWQPLQFSASSDILRSFEVRIATDDAFKRKFTVVRFLRRVSGVVTDKWVYVDGVGDVDIDASGGGTERDVPDGAQSLWNTGTPSAIGAGTKAMFHYLRILTDHTKTPPVLRELHSDNLSLTDLDLPMGAGGGGGGGRQDQLSVRIRGVTDAATALDVFVDDFLLSDEGT